MVIKATLSRDQFIRLSITRHLQRKHFYFYVVTFATLTGYGLVRDVPLFYYIAWIPLVIYLLAGIIGAIRDSADKTQPHFLPTTYEFTEKGVSVSTKEGSSQLAWEIFSQWNILVKCYVLVMDAGPILAIPKSAVPVTQIVKFENLLSKHIG